MRAPVLLWLACFACKPGAVDETDVTDEPRPFAWATANKALANCSLEMEMYANHGPRLAGRTLETYDANGLWVHTEYQDILYSDGDVISSEDREIDALGRVQRLIWTDERSGDVAYDMAITWDDAGPISAASTSPSGQIPEIVWTIEHDELGRATVESGDYAPYDGEPDEIWRMTYGPNDRSQGGPFDDWFAGHTETEYLGEPYTERSYAYDESGQILSMDSEGFGEYVYKVHCEYQWDDLGRRQQRDCECPEPCDKWNAETDIYIWTCPGDGA